VSLAGLAAQVQQSAEPKAAAYVFGGAGSEDMMRANLDADAVLVGRPYLWGLAAGGEGGVLAVLRTILAELDLTVGLTGHRSVSDLGPGLLVREP
jgi:L-lactate dehydrogenase (cytochrome)